MFSNLTKTTQLKWQSLEVNLCLISKAMGFLLPGISPEI